MDKILLKQAIADGEMTSLQAAFILVLSEHLPINLGTRKEVKCDNSDVPLEGYNPVYEGRFPKFYRKEVEVEVPVQIATEDDLEVLSIEELRKLAQSYAKEVKQARKEFDEKDSDTTAAPATDSVRNDKENNGAGDNNPNGSSAAEPAKGK